MAQKAARQAHNLQVIGSKPIVGICFFWGFLTLSPSVNNTKQKRIIN